MQIFQTFDNIFGTCWQQVCEGGKVKLRRLRNRQNGSKIFCNSKRAKIEARIAPCILTEWFFTKFKEPDHVPVAFCTVQQCGFFHEAGFRVDSTLFFLVTSFSGFPLYFAQARSWLSISGGGGGGRALQKECNRGVGMILTFVLAASFPFQLRKIGIERNVLLHCKSIILVLNFVISLSYFSIELTLYLDRLI